MWATHLVHFCDWLRSDSVGGKEVGLLLTFTGNCWSFLGSVAVGVLGFWRVNYHGSSVVELCEASWLCWANVYREPPAAVAALLLVSEVRSVFTEGALNF